MILLATAMSINVLAHDIHPVATALHCTSTGQQIYHRLQELPGKPLPGGDREPHLVATHSNILGNARCHGLAQDEFVPGTPHLPIVWERERKLGEPVVKKRKPRLDRMRH